MASTLVLDCVGNACSVALFDGDVLIADHHVAMARGHAEHLVPLIASLPQKGRADAIAVNIGPGSFTGVRIGLSVARALGLAWSARVVGYSALDLTAAVARAKGLTGPLCVILHGGHGEYFVQCFDGNGAAEGASASLPPHGVIALAKHRQLVGNAAKAPSLLALGLSGDEITPRASDLSSLDASHFIDANPHYGRAPDAAVRVKQ